ncbi:monoheme cytochrome C [Muricauda sp. 2012CJ35-5]|uniref:Monoheme cytochrome C n=1 Tax=Flagellimonas spongiicola TaxID=2942208 RepID=A0ABT0PT12_9FLAO|nr:monoheme cytochrome C [Allomuricauda spongiicola]MCL6274530.1 monoheme cytochrome C [Allomuricauda spongiicola]
MEQFDQQVKSLTGILFLFLLLIVFFFGGLFYLANNPETATSIVEQEQESEGTYKAIENGIHLDTGFVVDEGMEATIQNCTNCHSAKLVTQNRMSREGWEATIRWMQDTQNLWDLGNNEELILSYLAKNYAPTAKGRRQNLDQTEWYTLE